MTSKVKILVDDDEPDVLFGTSRVLKSAGFTVIEAETGKAALQLATTHLQTILEEPN